MRIFKRSKYILIFVFLLLSVFTVSFAFTIGQGVERPVISTPAETPSKIYINSEDIPFTIKGSADTGSLDVEVFRGDGDINTGEFNNSVSQGKAIFDNELVAEGNRKHWTLGGISSGGHYIARATDASGNKLDSSLVIIYVDIIRPEKPIITTSTQTVSSTSFTIEGTADDGTSIKLFRNDIVTNNIVTTDENGNWILENIDLNIGENIFSVTATNEGGHVSEESDTISITRSIISASITPAIEFPKIPEVRNNLLPQVGGSVDVNNPAESIPEPEETPPQNDPATGVLGGDGESEEDDNEDDNENDNDDDQPKRNRRPSGAVDSNEPPVTNTAPTITGTPKAAVNQSKEYNFVPTGNDVDSDTLTYSITNKPTWATFDTATGALTGTPRSTHVGTTRGIIISVSDGTETASLLAFDISVINPDPNNQAPIAITKFISTNFIGCVIKPSDTIIGYTNPIKAGKTVTLDGSDSYDPEGDVLTYRWEQPGYSELEDDRKVTLINPNSANPTFITNSLTGSVNDGEGLLLVHQVVFQLTVTDTNGGDSALVPQMNKSFISLTILPSDFNIDCPTITGTPATTVEEGKAYSFTPVGGDVDGGDTLTYSITNKPTWATLDPTTGALTGTPTSDNIGTTRGIVISVTNGIASASLSAFDLEVTNTNDETIEVSEDLTISTFYPDFNVVKKGVISEVKNGICVTFGENIHIVRVNNKKNVGVAMGDHLGFTVSTVTESGQTFPRKVTGISKCYTHNGNLITTKVNAFFINLKNEIESDTTRITLSYEKLPKSFPFVDSENNNRVLKDFSDKTWEAMEL